MAELIKSEAPELAARLPAGNEEADPLGGWSKVVQWRGDAQYPAAMARILAMHQATLRDGPVADGFNYLYHANDNAFLNYGDAWYDQRTLTVRFMMNLTGTVEVMPKPSLNLMALLAMLGDTIHPALGVSDPEASSAGVFATSRGLPAPASVSEGEPSSNISEVAVLLYNSGDLVDARSNREHLRQGLGTPGPARVEVNLSSTCVGVATLQAESCLHVCARIGGGAG